MPDVELPLCGHGTLAAAKVIFNSPDLQLKLGGKEELKFRTIRGKTVSARKADDDDRIQITFPHALLTPIALDSLESDKLRSVIAKALHSEDVAVNFMAKGRDGYSHYLMVELDKKEGLEGREIDCQALVRFLREMEILLLLIEFSE